MANACAIICAPLHARLEKLFCDSIVFSPWPIFKE